MGKTKRAPKLKLSADVIFTELDIDDGILLNLLTKNYYSLNETACSIVKGLRMGLDSNRIINNLSTRFCVPAKTVERDYRKTVSFLIKEKILI